MAFDKTKPAGSDKLRVSDDYIRANWEAIENALSQGAGMDFKTGGSQTGKFKEPTFMDIGSDPSPPLEAGEVKLYNKGGEIYTIGANGVVGKLDSFPPGTKMIFYQDSAPPGWTIDTSLNDKLVYITKGSAAGGQPGGSSIGSWTISGITVTVAGHALTIDEMPPHSHAYSYAYIRSPGIMEDEDSYTIGYTTKYTSTVGGGQPHSHGATVSHDGSWRPAAYTCIICTKE